MTIVESWSRLVVNGLAETKSEVPLGGGELFMAHWEIPSCKHGPVYSLNYDWLNHFIGYACT